LIMERLGIIHLSDTQFGKKHVFGSPSKLSQALAEDIAAMARQHGFVPLYLLVSGDISETAHGEEFADAARELARTARQSDIDVRSVLSIPGNHDVSWPLATVAAQVGNPDLPLENYRRFLSTLSAFDGPAQPGTTEQREVVHDHRHGITFLLMNSCRKESPTCHVGHVDPDTIAAAIAKIDSRPDARDYLRIAVLHHRLDSTVPGAATQVENAEEVEAMLMASGFSVVLTGHVHQGMCHIVEKANRRIAYSGCGSTGVDKTQRPEGVPNQYTIHVLDRGTNSLETIWRAYNPRSLGRLGLGAWTKDNTTDEPLARLALAEWRRVARVKRDHLRDSSLERRLRITSNPFVYSNAEKIADDLLLELFVSDDTRHQSAKRLSGDAIIRGPRGSGKTMFLRFLHLYGLALFEQAVRSQETAECFPVTVNLSRLHRSDLA
jgi:UDP-2,3-diacylglucosamine pyrophosphatase LpxH